MKSYVRHLLIIACTAYGWLGCAAPAEVRADESDTLIIGQLPTNLNQRAAALAEQRRLLMDDLRSASAAATATIKQLLPDPMVLSDPQRRAEIAEPLAAAVRHQAQVQIIRHDLGGRRNVLMLATGAKPGEGVTFVENSQWNAAILLALGDAEGARPIADYACFDIEVSEFAAEVLNATSPQQDLLVDQLRARILSDPLNEISSDEAVLVMKRRLGSDDQRQELLAAMQRVCPQCAPATLMFVRMAEAAKKFDLTSKLVGTRDFKVTGTLIDGTAFDSTSLAGKVVVVDFWATWCGPCVSELPRLAKLLEVHRDEGLAVIGISNDNDLETLQAFLKSRPDVSWPQLFDPTSAASGDYHVLTRNAGIQGIPALFVIDRQGVLRSVSARSTLEQTVAELLQEKMDGGEQ